MKYVTDTKFLIGLGVGYFVLPLVVKHARMQIERMRPASTTTTAA